MKRKRFSVLVLLGLVMLGSSLGVAQVAPIGEVTSSYDRFKDETTVQVSFLDTGMSLDKSEHWILMASFKGTRVTQQPPITLSLLTSSKDWQFLRADLTLRAIIGEERLTLSNMKRVLSDVGRGFVMEVLSGSVDQADLRKIVAAGSFEVQLWQLERKFTETESKYIGDFIAHLDKLK